MTVNAMSSRWVLQWKNTLGSDGKITREIKARLVLRGFLDPRANNLYTSSATASAVSHRVLMSKGVNENWPIISLDISTAFLQGLNLAILSNKEHSDKIRLLGSGEERRVFFDLPPVPTCSYQILYKIDPL